MFEQEDTKTVSDCPTARNVRRQCTYLTVHETSVSVNMILVWNGSVVKLAEILSGEINCLRSGVPACVAAG